MIVYKVNKYHIHSFVFKFEISDTDKALNSKHLLEQVSNFHLRFFHLVKCITQTYDCRILGSR